jgi:hypothetical protein
LGPVGPAFRSFDGGGGGDDDGTTATRSRGGAGNKWRAAPAASSDLAAAAAAGRPPAGWIVHFHSPAFFAATLPALGRTSTCTALPQDRHRETAAAGAVVLTNRPPPPPRRQSRGARRRGSAGATDGGAAVAVVVAFRFRHSWVGGLEGEPTRREGKNKSEELLWHACPIRIEGSTSAPPMTAGLSMGYAVITTSVHRSVRTTPNSVVAPMNFGSCLAKFLESPAIWDCAIQSGWLEFLLSNRHFRPWI